MARLLASDQLDLSSVWADLDLPRRFPEEVEAEARTVTDRARSERRDATDLPLVTVDPPGSMDLDQALALVGRGSGWRVHYAIADLGALLEPGGAVDGEARRRGETLYLPDGRVPLHPDSIGEGAASLLPDLERPAVLWTIDLDDAGRIDAVHLERVQVRSRRRLSYPELQDLLERGEAPEGIDLLPAIGAARQAQARSRGAIELGLPSQEVVARPEGGWTLENRAPLPVEGWNAHISLLTGEAAAHLMLDAGIGVLRTLPPPEEATVRRLRRAAPPLGVEWPEGALPGAVLAGCDARQPRHAAFLDLAADLLRGAGYTAFTDGAPEQSFHAGVASPYAHVTAPIRRLVDRFATEVCLAVAAGRAVPGWALEALEALPELMEESGHRSRQVERTTIDQVEAWLLRSQVGELYDVAVVEHDDERDRSTVVLDDPAVRAPCTGRPPLGERITARLIEVDVAARRVRFAPEPEPGGRDR